MPAEDTLAIAIGMPGMQLAMRQCDHLRLHAVVDFLGTATFAACAQMLG
jgi:hypothetical protein